MTTHRCNAQDNDPLPIVHLHGVDCTIRFDRYENLRTVIQLIDDEDYPYARATINVPEADLEPDEVLIKNWSENEGMLDALVAAGVVEDTGRTVPTGNVRANVVKLLVSPPEG